MIFLRNYYVNHGTKAEALTITQDVKRAIRESEVQNGLVTILVTGATAGLKLMEAEPKLHQAWLQYLERQFPVVSSAKSVSRRSGTGSDELHLRAALMSAQVSIPLQEGKLKLGNYQELILFDLENRAGRREFSVQVLSEASPPAEAAPAQGYEDDYY